MRIELPELPMPEVEDPAVASESVVTIRMSFAMHDALQAEASRVGLSLNRLCKLKLASALHCNVPTHWLAPHVRRQHEPRRQIAPAEPQYQRDQSCWLPRKQFIERPPPKLELPRCRICGCVVNDYGDVHPVCEAEQAQRDAELASCVEGMHDHGSSPSPEEIAQRAEAVRSTW